MNPDSATQRADALLRLERTRMQWVLRSAHHAERPGGAPGADDLATGSPLNAIVTQWLADEIAARLWPGDADVSGGDPTAPDSDAGNADAGHRAPLPSQLLTQTVSDWTSRHPWLGVLAGLLAGSVAMSQRQRLLQWGISAALPWLASNAAVLAVPLLAQWLERTPPHPSERPPGDQAAPLAEGAPHEAVSDSPPSASG